MQFKKLIESLERFASVLPALVDGLSEADAAWKPPNGNWSILEIVCHLIDEEVEDFGKRIQLVVENPELSWPSWDPVNTAVTRQYNEQNFADKVEEFVAARRRSVNWLKENTEVDWKLAYLHPTLGKISAGDLLGAWAAHDLLHVRQIGKRLYELNARDAAPSSVSYAGPLPL